MPDGGLTAALIATTLASTAASVTIAEQQNDAIEEAARREAETNKALAQAGASRSRAEVARNFDAMVGSSLATSAEQGTVGSQLETARTTSLAGAASRGVENIAFDLFNANTMFGVRQFNALSQRGNVGMAGVQGGLAGIQTGLSLYNGFQNAQATPGGGGGGGGWGPVGVNA